VNIGDLKKEKAEKIKDDKYAKLWKEIGKDHKKQSSGNSSPAPQDSGEFITDPSIYENNYTTVLSKDVTGYYQTYFRMSNFSSGGVCAPAAATNLCYYWSLRDPAKYGKLKDSVNGWQGTFNALFNLMGTSTSNGTYNSKVAPAFRAFFKRQGTVCTAIYFEGTDSGANIKSLIDSDMPCQLMVHNHTIYGDHAVLALGYKDYQYKYKSFINIKLHSIYIRIADGWSNMPTRFVWGKCRGNWDYVMVMPGVNMLFFS